ncbi:MAG: TauD/TfdA family dioxygenase [Parvibaculaceae bacterium]|nr:TauD/TfdA family dioxygenase [Parvibaculaceae bacterium]
MNVMTQRRYRHIHVEPQETGFGAEITGIDLSAPMSADVRDEIMRAWAAHAVIWFPGQPLSLDALEAFTQSIGPFGVDPFIKSMEGRQHVLELRREPDEKAANFGASWHSDWSFQETPPAATLLHASVVPPVGGDTLYADGVRAYEALSPVMKRLLDGLEAIHSASFAYGTRGFFAKEAESRTMQIIVSEEAEKTCAHPLVRTHPVTGRKALYVSPTYTVGGIVGMTAEESRALLGFLFAHMVREEFVYRHKWRKDMLIMWDNRCTLHYADGGYDGHLRVMHRTTVAGGKPV